VGDIAGEDIAEVGIVGEDIVVVVVVEDSQDRLVE